MTVTVTPERAQLLAAHAIHVQGGFSTPDVEKARVEADGTEPDWDKIKQEVEKALLGKVVKPQPTPAPAEEVEAQELEGLAPMPLDVQALREEKLAIDAQIEELNGRLRDIKADVDTRLKDLGLQGWTLNGKVKVRRSQRTRSSVDAGELKKDLPSVYQKYLRLTKYVQINISK